MQNKISSPTKVRRSRMIWRRTSVCRDALWTRRVPEIPEQIWGFWSEVPDKRRGRYTCRFGLINPFAACRIWFIQCSYTVPIASISFPPASKCTQYSTSMLKRSFIQKNSRWILTYSQLSWACSIMSLTMLRHTYAGDMVHPVHQCLSSAIGFSQMYATQVQYFRSLF
jgi:hypothetical protein